MFSSARLVGNVAIRDRKLGKITLEIRSPQAMLTAIQALKTRLGDRLQIHLEWCEEQRSFVRK